MRFVETNTCEHQSILMLYRVRLMHLRQRTMLTNAIRAYLAEFGLGAKTGRRSWPEPVSWRSPSSWCWSSARSWGWTGVLPPATGPARSVADWLRSPALAAARISLGGTRSQPAGFRLRPQALGLGRAGAEVELQRRQVRLGCETKQGNRYLRSLLTVGALGPAAWNAAVVDSGTAGTA